MKYILIFFLSLVLVQPAFAARLVRGTVPALPPLQAPAPGNVAQPNVSGNIEFNNGPQTGDAGSPTISPNTSGTQNSAQAAASQQPSSQAVPAKNSGHWIVWLLFLLAVAGLVWWRFGRK